MRETIVAVEFRQDMLFAVERDDGVFVAVRPIANSLGLEWSAQRDRLNQDAALSEGIRMVAMPAAGGTQTTPCIRLELVNGWLFGIDEKEVADEQTRERVLFYKRECYGILFKYFYGREIGVRSRDIHAVGEYEPILARRSLVTEARQTHGVQAARELWFQLGLPSTPAMYAEPSQGDFFYTATKRKDTTAA